MCSGNSGTARAGDDKKARTCNLNCLSFVPGGGVNSSIPSWNRYALSIGTPACQVTGDSDGTSAILFVDIYNS
jgi:hypothetical protein